MRHKEPIAQVTGLHVVLLGVLVCGCSDDPGSSRRGTPSAPPVKVDLVLSSTNTRTILQAATAALPGCTFTSTQVMPPPPTHIRGSTPSGLWLGSGIYGLRGTPPADLNGTCGGVQTFTNYSHDSGKTQGKLVLQNYCSAQSDGTESTVNGEIAFNDNGTPSDYGPLRSTLTANGTGLTLASPGKSLTSSFSGFSYRVTTPGSYATNAKPDVMSISSVDVKDNNTNTTYRAVSYSETIGATEFTVTTFWCDSSSGCVKVQTDPSRPITMEVNTGNYLSGTINVTGASNTSAVFSIVPGEDPALSLTTLNGEDQSAAGIRVDCLSVPL